MPAAFGSGFCSGSCSAAFLDVQVCLGVPDPRGGLGPGPHPEGQQLEVQGDCEWHGLQRVEPAAGCAPAERWLPELQPGQPARGQGQVQRGLATGTLGSLFTEGADHDMASLDKGLHDSSLVMRKQCAYIMANHSVWSMAESLLSWHAQSLCVSHAQSPCPITVPGHGSYTVLLQQC